MDERDEDLDAFDPNIPEEGPSAPPPGWLDDIHGYQGHKGGQDDNPLYPPPPPYSPQPELNKNTLVPNVRVPTISEDEARDALLKFVQSKWTYSSKPARNLTFKELKPITVYRYRLETYTETRTSAWQFEPYNGQMVDGPQFGMCPPPWDIPVTLPQRYTSMVEKIRVPHTSFVKLCHTCNGCGKTRCTNCSGRGRKLCLNCHGRGHKKRSGNRKKSSGRRVCPSCHGRGRKRCISCQGQGYKTCSVCHGSQNLLHFILLTVTWKNNVDQFIPDRQPDFPDKKFQRVTGDPFFIDENVLVYPIQGFPDQEICDASMKMINEHLNRFSSTSRILQQRQTIELVPLTHAYYSYKGKDRSYFVYGTENKVFTSKYPSACTIL
ncbi:protein SSUH2 homolog isoform X3 [Xiphias gladius]|uniref:protein SSUH2 homolog isoform X3 n=1 Tax=Xiphias gladius TaxID=8245 RepID=UPI001A98CEB0|nr:protein SSUH2 homolog isoform X3 [Xiphias gladius]XP_039971672.1 protein SSUH2 homolog isoform X3 [Xiphias gladius]XP_039971674.1 protein SSUH2 homolog isoform X3 [Xiphias gladius]